MFMTDLLSEVHCSNGSMMDNACYVHTDSSGKTMVEVLNPGVARTAWRVRTHGRVLH